MKANTPKIEVKHVKHVFSAEERNQIGADLARSIGQLRGIETEFDQVKASFKARITECEAKMDTLSTSLVNGFDMRNKRCTVTYRPKDREKDYRIILSEDGDRIETDDGVVITEPMTAGDFQIELVQAESRFDHREEIELFKPVNGDSGVLVVGAFARKWFSALRVKIGNLTLNERLDSEQQSFKARADAVRHAVKRVKEWARTNLKEHAKGFDQSFDAVVEAHKERAE